jgi:hypothetical protein
MGHTTEYVDIRNVKPARLYRILCKRSKIPITQETASCPGNSQTCIVPMNCSMSF